MKIIEVIVHKKSGLHARWAAELVKLTTNFQSNIQIEKDSQCVDGKSIMGILTLAAGHQSKLTFIVDGHDEEEAIQAIDNFFQTLTNEEYSPYF